MGEYKDYLSTTQENGAIHISEEVIASIAALAASEVEGVSGLSANFTDLLGKKNLGRGVKLTVREEGLSIDCFVVALFGYSVIEIAKNVQERVTSSVESMTGAKVQNVNVEICGVSLPKEQKK